MNMLLRVTCFLVLNLPFKKMITEWHYVKATLLFSLRSIVECCRYYQQIAQMYKNAVKKVLPIKGGFFLQISHLYMVKVQDNEHV